MKRVVQFERIYPHAPERVWRALTDSGCLARWLMPNNFQPRLGYRFRFTERKRTGRRRQIACEVIALEEARRLAYTWQPEPDAPPSIVTWTLEPVEAGTRLRLEHTGAETIHSALAQIRMVAGLQNRLDSKLPQTLAPRLPLSRRIGCIRTASRETRRPVLLSRAEGTMTLRGEIQWLE